VVYVADIAATLLIGALSARNAALEKENQDLNQLLEDSNYELLTKNKHLELTRFDSVRGLTNNLSHGHNESISNSNVLFNQINFTTFFLMELMSKDLTKYHLVNSLH